LAEGLVECVPNFSEGRDAGKIKAIAEAIASVDDIIILDRTQDRDHNRSVITFAGPPGSIGEAAVRGAGKAVELIDLTKHKGVHPRIGAVDVIPFIPIEGIALSGCALIAEWTGQQIWERFQVPVYLYEAAARRPDRVNLENIRRGRFEALREDVRRNPDRRPDFGECELHPTAGAVAVGARKFLIAFNINLGTQDLDIARQIAVAVRSSSGGLPYVKAMGVPLASRRMVQVTMNLTDYERTPIGRVFEAVRKEAAIFGVPLVSSEIIGLIPQRALDDSAHWLPTVENFQESMILENRLKAANLAARTE
jgi:glutamate formiminotransferase / formiminotetrahydrofolate cyclodeaminase